MVLSQPSVTELRPALDHALAQARSWTKTHSSPLPGRVQELVNSRRRSMPENWATTIKRALELDAGFRAEVASSASEEALGRVAWLWLARPEGWSKEVAQLRSADAGSDSSEKDERLAAHHLAALERRLAKAERDAARLERVNEEQQAENARLRQTRSALEERARQADQAGRDARAEAARADKSAAELRRTTDTESRRRQRVEADLDQARQRIAGLDRELRSVHKDLAAVESRLAEVLADGARRSGEFERMRAAVSGSLAAAAAAAAELIPALDSASKVVDGGAGPANKGSAPNAAKSSVTAATKAPVALPPGIFDDSPEAVEFLLRVPGVCLVVDGYNVGLTSWPGHDLPALRDRLVSAVAELVLRARLSALVIFDGDGEGGRVPPPRAARSLLTVMFSASNVEADHEIILASERLGASRPVVVATDDRAVQDAARLRKANVITVNQFLTGLSRHTSLR